MNAHTIIKLFWTGLFLLLFFSPSPDVFATTYKCTDEDGRVTYKTGPCPPGHMSEEIKSSNRSSGAPSESNPANSYDYEEQQYGYEKVKIISRGRLVDLIDHIEPGKYTAFMFYADWCAPCKTLKPRLEEFAESGSTLALREIDIINWENPLVRYYNLPTIPYFIVYGPDGNFIERGPGITNETLKEIAGTD